MRVRRFSSFTLVELSCRDAVITVDADGYLQLDDEVLDWMGDTMTEDRYHTWCTDTTYLISFKHEADVLLFRIAWTDRLCYT